MPWSQQKYRKTIDGFLRNTWGNMQNRVAGKGRPSTRHIYTGLPLVEREKFVAWGKTHLDFLFLYKKWASSGYSYKLSPSINRVNGKLGYTIGNMEWLTHSKNSALGGMKNIGRRRRTELNMCIERLVAIAQSVE